MGILLADVAREAGVSPATASRVLSGSSYPVSDQVRERVLRVAEELGYRPNALARALATQHSRVVGVIIGDVTDPYFATIARGIEDYARSLEYLTIVCNADRSPQTELAYLEMLQEQHAAGIIFTGGIFSGMKESEALKSAVREAVERGERIIALAERDFGNVPRIMTDNRRALYDVTQYLIHLGHRRISYVDGPRGFTTGDLRREGYYDAMREAGLEPNLVAGGFDYESGRVSGMRLLAAPLPDAIIVFNDESAIGVITTLRQAGVQIPEQVSIAGVDGTRYAELMDLTTVNLPMYELGALAARSLLAWDDSPIPPLTILPHRVVPRGTTARAHS